MEPPQWSEKLARSATQISAKFQQQEGKYDGGENRRQRSSRNFEGLVDARFLQALSHPLRVRILSILNERTSSPSDLAEELNASVNDVAYHTRELAKLEQIELVRTAQRRGATEHYYRGIRRALIPPDAWKQLPMSVQAKVVADTYELIINDAAQAVAADAYSKRPDSHVSWTPMTLDEQGWGEFVELLAATLDRGMEIAAGASGRLAESGSGGGFSVTMALAGFESTRDTRR